MPRKRIKSGGPGDRPRHFIKEWRDFRELSQEELAAAVDLSPASISQIENGSQGYSQGSLEALAEALRTDPASLLIRHPNDPEGVWTAWGRVPPPDRPRVIGIMKAFAAPADELMPEPATPTKRGRKSSAFGRKAS